MLFVANWKNFFTTKQALNFVSEHLDGLKAMTVKHQVVLCPPATAISPILSLVRHTHVEVGSQVASAYGPGAYTGEITAQDLHELGCGYAIVGHSERRGLFGLTDEVIAQTCSQLVTHNVTPILCIGETEAEHEQGRTQQVLKSQLDPVFAALKKLALAPADLVIAYEPRWAIGTGKVPRPEELEAIFIFLGHYVDGRRDVATSTLIYGGSVKSSTRQTFDDIPGLGGFLIGGASLDFQELKKIVDYPL